MTAKDLRSGIARLRREIERLSAEHPEKIRKGVASASSTTREMKAKRAEILARRIRRLNEMLDALPRGESE